MEVFKTSSNSESEGLDSSFHWYRDCFKRILDILISLIGIVVLAIPMLIIALIIKTDSPKEKVLFKQVRVGKNNRCFTILKFRSMRQDAPHQMATGEFKNSQEYITKIGRVLRKTSLDELPQLFNVVKGDMSLIGPRPLIPKEKKVLGLRKKLGALSILPGITGLAQVHGRDELSNKEKALYDGSYTHRISFRLDLRIFLKTICDVIQSKGIHDGDK